MLVNWSTRVDCTPYVVKPFWLTASRRTGTIDDFVKGWDAALACEPSSMAIDASSMHVGPFEGLIVVIRGCSGPEDLASESCGWEWFKLGIVTGYPQQLRERVYVCVRPGWGGGCVMTTVAIVSQVV